MDKAMVRNSRPERSSECREWSPLLGVQRDPAVARAQSRLANAAVPYVHPVRTFVRGKAKHTTRRAMISFRCRHSRHSQGAGGANPGACHVGSTTAAADDRSALAMPKAPFLRVGRRSVG